MLGNETRYWLWAVLVLTSCGGCGERRQTVSTAVSHDGVAMTDLRLIEEHDGKISLDLRARSAQMQPRERAATLQHLEATFEVPEAGPVRLRADRGLLRERGERLEVQGSVEARLSDGARLRTGRAVYRVAARQLRFPGAVSAKSRRVEARGARARFDVGKQVLTLEGGVEARLWP